jgi:hypothetical protein
MPHNQQQRQHSLFVLDIFMKQRKSQLQKKNNNQLITSAATSFPFIGNSDAFFFCSYRD